MSNGHEVVEEVPEPTEQDWGLALLFSVQPTDRALAGWQGGTAPYLERLAEIERDGGRQRILPMTGRRR